MHKLKKEPCNKRHSHEQSKWVKMIELLAFLVTAATVSLSGVIMPGPVFAATVARGYESKNAGILIALGHGVVEFPLMFLVYLGFAQFVSAGITMKIIGIAGGTVLIYMGVQIFRARRGRSEEEMNPRHGSLIAGITTTAANPYFFLWWATVGLALITQSREFGLLGFLLFVPVHWFCDLSWYLLVSRTVFRSRRFWTERVRRGVFIVCGFIMIGFGIWFLLSGLGVC